MTSVLHVLDHSLPEQSGYASRSHSILEAQVDMGFDVRVLTGPKQTRNDLDQCRVGNVLYNRTHITGSKQRAGAAGQLQTILKTRRRIGELVEMDRPSVLHAHSPCLNGLAAMWLGIPLVYESEYQANSRADILR